MVLCTAAWNFESYEVLTLALALALALVLVAMARRGLAVRRTVRALRRLDPAFRRRIIRSIDSAIVGRYYDERLAAEGEPEIAGLVERYPFSPSDAREESLRYWIVLSIGAGALLALLVWPRMSVWRLVVAGVVIVLSVVALLLIRRRIAHLQTVLEVSPFSLTEVGPDGARRTIAFNQPLALGVNRWRGRIVLAIAHGARRQAIVLDFDRLGFNRLIGRVMAWGGFARQPTSSDSPPAPTEPAPAEPAVQRISIPVPWEIPTVRQYSIQRVATALWPTFVALALLPLLHRLSQATEPRFVPLPVAAAPAAPMRVTDDLSLDTLIAKSTAFAYPGEFLVLANRDTVWIEPDGREDSATVLRVRYPQSVERLWVVRASHRLIRRQVE
jgi:hypothetical protein